MNDISGYKTPIGGGLASGVGGCLLIHQTLFGGLATSDLSDLTNFQELDVRRWRTLYGFQEGAIAASGALGATRSRRTGYAYTWEAEVLLDMRRQPELILRNQLGCQILFKISRRGMASIPSSINGDVLDKYLWCPLARIVSASEPLDAGEPHMVRQEIVGTAGGHILTISDFADISDPNTVAGAYWNWLTNKFKE